MVWLEILFTGNKKSLDYFKPLCNVLEFQDGGFSFVKTHRGKLWANTHVCKAKYIHNKQSLGGDRCGCHRHATDDCIRGDYQKAHYAKGSGNMSYLVW
jgi:hypothetical protein